ncbi:MAG TPA: biotin synthase BioB, partial [Planctomycetaceae bacterium]|nr:biotin synthase BioB [Planctomycetaceae bacterium]
MSATISTPVENWDALADKVLEGGILSREEALAVLGSTDGQLLPLLAATSRVRQRYFGNQVQLYYLRNAKSGLCPEDCHYCSQSKISEAPIEKYVMQNEEKLLE